MTFAASSRTRSTGSAFQKRERRSGNEQVKKHAASVLNRVADEAKQAGVPCDTMQVENARPIKPLLQRPRTGAAISSS
jgi:hypothetical protein